MKHIHEMLREKQLELARLQKEVEALRLVAGMIGQESKAESIDPVSLPAAQEIPLPRPLAPPTVTSQISAAPTAPVSIPAAPLNPPPMIMRPPTPAFGEAALASANDALAKRFP